jgi:hypothetical protein
LASSYISDGIDTYPPANCDPREKGYDWIMAYCRAAYSDSKGYMVGGYLNTGNWKMNEIKLYAMGKQPVDKYKKQLSPGNPSDPSWRAISWEPLAAMCKYREIGISKCLQKRFDIQAFAIDPLARSEEDDYFNQMKVKMMMREAAQKAGSPLADSPLLAPQPGEPEDMEQLQIQEKSGYKHVMAMTAEEAISLINYQNNDEEIRKAVVTSLYDYGIGARTQWIDENGMVKQRAINMENFGCSYCEKPDFSDMVHWFEIVPTYVADLAPYYTKEQLDDICRKALSKNGNPTAYTPFNGYFNKAWNRFKVMVMQIKFLSWNDTIYKEEKDGRQNTRFGKSDYKNKQFLSVNEKGGLEESDNGYFAPLNPNGEQGSATPKYIKSTKKVSYKASWIIDTEYMHDWGLRENQNRKLSSWWDTDLDIQVYAWNFHKMQFTGITERLIKLEDDACMTWFNLQNLSNKLIPYLINIDFNAVEAVNFGKGGQKSKPSEIIDFIFSNFVVPYRSTDLLSRNPNYKPVSIESTGQLAAFAQLYQKLENTINMMRQISGLNEATDGSTVNPKNLNSTNAAMVESTNNAMFLLSEADKYIIYKTADATIQKVQIAVKLGKVEGYAKALGSNAVKFLSINPDIALHELGIFIEEAPTKEQREALWADCNLKESQGLLTIGDKIMIMNCRNLKEAALILDYKVEKRREESHLQQLQVVQQQTQGNMEVAAATEQMKRETIQLQGEIEVQKMIIEKQMEFEIESMKKQMDFQGEAIQAEGRLDVSKIAAQAKVIAQQIAAGSHLSGKEVDSKTNILGKVIAGESALQKQELANKKPQSTTKK